MRPRDNNRRREDSAYTSPSCGETIDVALDRSGGDEQEYVEDCPVCCNPNVIHVEYLGDEEPPRVWAEAE